MDPTEKDICWCCGLSGVRVWHTTGGNLCASCKASRPAVKYTYDYQMPSITATCVVICAGHFAVITRRDDPFKGCLALPGGFMNLSETNRHACVREVEEEIGLILDQDSLTLVCVNDDVNRDPRGRVVDFAYSVIVPMIALRNFRAGDDAASADWFPIDDFEDPDKRPIFAFDHAEIIGKAIQQRRNKNK